MFLSAMRFGVALLGTVSLAFSAAVAPPQAAVKAAPLSVTRTKCTLAPGVELLQEITPEGLPDGPLTVTVLKVNPRKGARLFAALGQDKVWGDDPTFGRETVSRYLSRHPAPVVAAINAGFFPFAGNPIGLHVQDGEMVTEPLLNRSSFCLLKNGKAVIEAFTFRGTVFTGAKEDSNALALNGMNRRPGKGNEVLLFTPRWGRLTLRAPGRVEVILSGVPKVIGARQTLTGTVTQVASGGGILIPPGSMVVSAGGASAPLLRQRAVLGTRMSVHLETETVSGQAFPAQDIKEAVTGGPRLLTDGRVTIRWAEEGMGQAFSTARHPRTAIGITPEGMFLLVTVDGRQKGLSRGASLPELAQILLKFGAANAVNLDGGGSSCVMARGLILNAPSDGRERPVANFLVVSASMPSEKEKGSKVRPVKGHLLPSPRALFPGETWTLVSPVQKEWQGVWGLPGGQPVAGFVSQTGVFHAMRPGNASVTFVPNDGGAPISVVLSVIADPRAGGQSLTEPPPPAARTGAPLP